MIGSGSQNQMNISKSRKTETNGRIRKMNKRAVTFFPPLTTMHSNGSFDENLAKSPNSRSQAVSGTDGAARSSLNRRLINAIMVFSKLRIYILSDRRVFFAGKIPKGIYIARDRWLQNNVIKRMILWYLPCLELQGNYYNLNNACYTRKENKLLIMLRKSLKHTRNLPKSFLDPSYFM